MERFAIINDKIRLNLYNICRLCGIDNPSKIKILDSLKIKNDSEEEEPCLSKKIECVVGIKVKRNDQMPQSICTLCADKINDFFEYREMCGATNIQTRKLLGIPLEVAKRKRLNNDKEIKVEGESILGLGIEDEDNTDNKSSAKQTKHHRVKGRPKKKGNSSKKKVLFKDEDVKAESEEIKTEIPTVKINNSIGKRIKIDLKKIADPTPLLTLKEPNKRERRREIDAQKIERRRIREEQKREIEEKKREIELAKQILEQKKLEKKRKRKGSDPELPLKKLKHEPEVSVTSLQFCSICSASFPTSDLLSTHLHQSHTVTVSTYGCSSCSESFKSLDEEKDHELWHSLSKTSYICPICNVAFEKTSIFTRHITLCKPFTLTPTVTNIHCAKCSQEFLTQNLYQWHSCFVKPNGTCWHCNRPFVKASTLFKHSFKCSSTRQSTDTSHKYHIANTSTVSESKKHRKVRKADRESHIKSEPEVNLDVDVPDVPPSHLLTSDMLPVVVLTKTNFRPNHTFAINAEDMSIKTENDFDFEDNLQMDEPFRDDDHSDSNDEPEQPNDVAVDGAMNQTEPFSDDDVILIENNEEPVLVNGSPSGSRCTTDKPFVLPIVIKREPVDNYDVMAPPIFDPTKRIKSEPLDENADVSNDMEKQLSPKRSSLKNRKSKKSTHKSYKDRQHLVHIKQEPMDPDELFRTSHNMGSAVVSLPTTSLLETTIKQEPVRPGYDDDFDPVLAMNIKKEPGLDDSSSCKLPSLRLIISKKHGTLNAKLISAQGHNTDNVDTSPKSAKAKRAKDKRLYRKPALLAEKIRQEMIARITRDKESGTTSQHSSDETNDFTVPVIARVLDATTISDLPLVRVKIERKSPCHSLSTQNSELMLDSLANCIGNSSNAFQYDQLNSAIDTTNQLPLSNDRDGECHSVLADFNSLAPSFECTRQPIVAAGSVNMEQNNVVSDSEELKLLLEMDSLCGMQPVDDNESNELPQKFANDAKISNCENEQNNGTKCGSGHDATNDDLMELAGMTLSEFMKRDSNEESNGHTTLEPTDFAGNRVCNDLMENQQQHSFDPIPFHDTDHHLSADRNTFKISGEHKVSYEEINDIISTLPLSIEQNVIKEVISLNSNGQSSVVVNNVSNTSELLSSKEKADAGNSVYSDSIESNKLNYSNVNTHSSSESSICNEALVNAKLKSTDEFLANCRRRDDDAVENELLKSPVHDNSDYELNSVQTLTTSAIHEQLHSLLEDISEDSLSCDIDLDDKTVDWEWESKLLGD